MLTFITCCVIAAVVLVVAIVASLLAIFLVPCALDAMVGVSIIKAIRNKKKKDELNYEFKSRKKEENADE